MRHTCLLDWDGTLRRGVTTLDFVRFCARSNDDLDCYVKKIENLLTRVGDIEYDEVVERVAEVFVEAVSRFSADEVDHLENVFIEKFIDLYDYSLSFIEALVRNNFEIYVFSGAVENIIVKTLRYKVPQSNICGLRYIVKGNKITGISGKELGTFAGKLRAIGTQISDDCVADLAVGDAPADSALFNRSRISVLLVESGKHKKFGYSGTRPTLVVPKIFFKKFIDTIVNEARDNSIETAWMSITQAAK